MILELLQDKFLPKMFKSCNIDTQKHKRKPDAEIGASILPVVDYATQQALPFFYIL